MTRTAPCSECQQAFSAVVVVCPFCAARRSPSAMAPAAARLVAKDAPAAARAAPSLYPCPQCGVRGVLLPMRIQSWRDGGLGESGGQRWRVVEVERRLQCGACARGLAWGRRLASFLTMLPVGVAVAAGMTSLAGHALGLWFAIFYGGYLVRWGSYSWADWLVYGRRLGRQLFGSARSDGKIRFPIEGGDLLWRIAFLVGLAGTGAAVGAALSSAAAG